MPYLRYPKTTTPKLWAGSILAIFLTGCSVTPKAPGIAEEVCWNQLKGWQDDQLVEAIPALQSQCDRLSKKDTVWKNICEAAPKDASTPEVRRFFETHFSPHNIVGLQNKNQGLITGYYEPTLYGSFERSERFNYPIYQRPDDMLEVRLESRFPTLKNQRVRARIEGNKIVPYYSRAEIDGNQQPLKGHEIIWVDDADAAFFLHIQGSGRVQLPDGNSVGVGYADQNGHPYHAIGKSLIAQGELTRENVSLQTIRAWLKNNPDKASELKNSNPSYIFFQLRHDLDNGPRGSLNVPLTPERSVAVDRKIIPLGTPLWINTQLPNTTTPYQRLVFAQDTGGAINGPVRADLFFGKGDRAEQLAGEMKQTGSLFALLPKPANAKLCN